MLSNRKERDIKRYKLNALDDYINLTLTQMQLGVKIDEKYLRKDLTEVRRELIKLNER